MTAQQTNPSYGVDYRKPPRHTLLVGWVRRPGCFKFDRGVRPAVTHRGRPWWVTAGRHRAVNCTAEAA
jgi:hypothetical protein